MNNLEQFYRDAGRARRQRRLTRDEECDLIPRAQRGEQTARDELVVRLGRQVYAVIQSTIDVETAPVDLADLAQEAYVGLMSGLDGYEPGRELRLSTYTEFWIWRKVSRYLDQHRISGVRLPYYRTQQRRLLARLGGELMQQLQREPTVAELAAAAGLTEQDLIDVEGAAGDPIWLDAANEEDDAPIENLADDCAPPPWVLSYHHEMLEQVERLPARQGEILARRFGLGQRRPETLEQIGNDLGLTRERVRQIEVVALKTLRRRLD